MHAVILAGGQGVRLRPYTTALPKPLVPIGDRYTILEIILNQLAARGFRSVTLAINHLGELIRAFAGDGSRWGMTIEYLTEDAPLSTVGPLFGLRDRLPERFLVMNGDVLTDLDYGDLLHSHELSGAALTVATAERPLKIDFGVLTVDGPRLIAFTEKPTYHYQVSMGVYAMSRAVLHGYPAGLPFGFDQLLLDLLAREEYPQTYAFKGFWVDVGRPEDYDRVNRDFAELAPILLPSPDGAAV
ncbi:sugar phosphate nucleotidyltransferase [Dactylosporangium sp. NPDC051541]|uniref:sugar phosphate nucleotidyltransferase n=1 Tax=Dactylosporangium sp. NPDC051541 TaxID=3363977 RepID=UPI0037B530D4